MRYQSWNEEEEAKKIDLTNALLPLATHCTLYTTPPAASDAEGGEREKGEEENLDWLVGMCFKSVSHRCQGEVGGCRGGGGGVGVTRISWNTDVATKEADPPRNEKESFSTHGQTSRADILLRAQKEKRVVVGEGA